MNDWGLRLSLDSATKRKSPRKPERLFLISEGKGTAILPTKPSTYYVLVLVLSS